MAVLILRNLYRVVFVGVALMTHMDIFDTQILAQNLINGARLTSFPLQR